MSDRQPIINVRTVDGKVLLETESSGGPVSLEFLPKQAFQFAMIILKHVGALFGVGK